MRVRAARAAGVSDTTPWLVVKYGPEAPANTFRLACLRCGDTHDTPFPIRVDDIVNLERAFRGRHKGCVEVAPADPPRGTGW